MGKRHCPKCKSEDLWVNPLKIKVDRTIYGSVSCGTCGHKVFGASAEKEFVAISNAWLAWEEDVSVSHVEETFEYGTRGEPEHAGYAELYKDLTRSKVVNAIRGYMYGKTKKKA